MAAIAGDLEVRGMLAFHRAWAAEYPAALSLGAIVADAHRMTVRAERHLVEHGFHRGAYVDMLDLTSPSMFLVIRSDDGLARARADIRIAARVPGSVLTAAFMTR